MHPPYHIAIIGGGVAGFAVAGHLTRKSVEQHLPKMRDVSITIFQPPSPVDEQALGPLERSRVQLLREQGVSCEALMGGGAVYTPLAPSLFTFNGDSSVAGFDFARGRFERDDYFTWMQRRRDTLAGLYPEFTAECPARLHAWHDIDDISHTSPRGAYGLYLHEKFQELQTFAAQQGITLKVVQERVEDFSITEDNRFTLAAGGAYYESDSLVCADGHRYTLPGGLSLSDNIYLAYPASSYHAPLAGAEHVAVIGAGPAGVETALHLVHHLNMPKVSLVSRRGYSRLPDHGGCHDYQPSHLTREQFLSEPSARHARKLLQREAEHAYAHCGKAYPGWEALTQIASYPEFLRQYLHDMRTEEGPQPLSLLIRPVLSFYGTIKGDAPPEERVCIREALTEVEHLFATQALPAAELLLQALDEGRIALEKGMLHHEKGALTVQLEDGRVLHPSIAIIAAGFERGLSPLYARAVETGRISLDASAETGLLLHPKSNRVETGNAETLSLYDIHGDSLAILQGKAKNIASSVAYDILAHRTHVEKWRCNASMSETQTRARHADR